MKFLVDAQLPVRLAQQISRAGHDAIHTSELPAGNRTTDALIAEVADADDRVVITKDRDFRNSHPCERRQVACSSSRPGTSPTTTWLRSHPVGRGRV